MALSDQDRWILGCNTLNERILSFNGICELHNAITSQIRKDGCYYRFSPERFFGRRAKLLDSKISRDYRLASTKSGAPIVEAEIATALRPALLPLSVIQKLRLLGYKLEIILNASQQYIKLNPELLKVFGSPIKGEFEWIWSRPKGVPLAQWTRIDFLWCWQDEKPKLTILDVNLLPGMTFINERLASNCAENLCKFGICDANQVADRFDASPLITEIINYHSKRNQGASEELRLLVLSREFHGLGADSDICSARLSEKLKFAVDTFSPVALATHMQQLRAEVQIKESFNGIIRMARPVSKHASGLHGQDEDIAFQRIVADMPHPGFIFPLFNAYLENHAWFHLWKTKHFEFFAKEKGIDRELQNFCSMLPETSIVSNDGNIVHKSGHRPLNINDLKDKVIKRGNSTGAQDLLVLYRPSKGQLESAMNLILSSLESGWVVQDRIETPKGAFPVINSEKKAVLLEGFMLYAAYFCNSQYLGSHALINPTSRKVHGGFDTLLIPVYPF